MKQPSCMVCGTTRHLLADNSRRYFVCGEHIMQVKIEFGWGVRGVRFAPYDTDLPLRAEKTAQEWAKEYAANELAYQMRTGVKKAMAANNKVEAGKEGKEFARLLGALVEKKKNPDFEAVADFASYAASSLAGYADADRANAYTKAFIGEWISQPKEAQDTLNLDTVNLLRQALGMEPLPPVNNLLPGGTE